MALPAETTLRRIGSDLGTWLGRAGFVVLAISGMELALVVPVFPAAASSGAGLLLSLVAVARAFARVALPLALLGLALDSARVLRRLPDPAWLLGACLGTLAVALGLHAGVLALLRIDVDFKETFSGLLLITLLAAVGAAHLATELVFQPAAAWLLARMPRLGGSRAVTAFVLATSAALLLFIGHFVLAPVHEVTLAALAGCGTLALGLTALRVAAAEIPRRVWAPAALLLLLVVASAPLGGRYERFILFGPASTAGAIAARVRELLDRDGDGTGPTWAGGTDCAEGDPTRGPLVLEIPGDHIDQDCQGGDAPSAPARSGGGGQLWPGCAPPTGPRSLLLVTIDAMRADALNPQVSPNLLELARAGVTFARAYSPSTMTGASFAAMFAGKPVSDLNARNVVTDSALLMSPTLAQRLSGAGYRTASFNQFDLSAAILAGFEEQTPYPIDVQPRGKGQLLAASMTNGALAYIDRRDPRPFFVWVHYLDTHAPYVFDEAARLSRRQLALTPYERGVQYVDEQVGRLLGELSRRHLLGSIVLAVAADHGEMLGRRARKGHGPYLFEATVRVPLIVWAPGCAHQVIERPVSTTRLAATLGALSGVRVPGYDLLPGGDDDALPVVVEEAPLDVVGFKRAIVRGPYKLIVDQMNGGRMLFDLEADPGEAQDVYDAVPLEASLMEGLYQAWLDRPGAR